MLGWPASSSPICSYLASCGLSPPPHLLSRGRVPHAPWNSTPPVACRTALRRARRTCAPRPAGRPRARALCATARCRWSPTMATCPPPSMAAARAMARAPAAAAPAPWCERAGPFCHVAFTGGRGAAGKRRGAACMARRAARSAGPCRASATPGAARARQGLRASRAAIPRSKALPPRQRAAGRGRGRTCPKASARCTCLHDALPGSKAMCAPPRARRAPQETTSRVSLGYHPLRVRRSTPHGCGASQHFMCRASQHLRVRRSAPPE
jgi:hypothetical protein